MLCRIPKFGFLLGYTYIYGKDGMPSLGAAAVASICSAPFINPVRMIEKQQRAFLKQTGIQKPLMEILSESAVKKFRPLFRGTIPLVGHSLVSASLGLVGQPHLQKKIKEEVGIRTRVGTSASNLIASAIVSPIYVLFTNPLSRLEVIMQTSSIDKKRISFKDAVAEIGRDMRTFGVRGVFRGQGIGIAKAIVSLSLFHEGRIFTTNSIKRRNERNGWGPH